jgi:hypothetical protein
LRVGRPHLHPRSGATPIRRPQANMGTRSALAACGRSAAQQLALARPVKRQRPRPARRPSVVKRSRLLSPRGPDERARTPSRAPLAARSFTPAVLSARTLSRRAPNAPPRPKTAETWGRKGNGPEDRSSGPLFTWCSRQVRDEREMAPEEGIEPPTRRLTAACSTTELLRKVGGPIDGRPPRPSSRDRAQDCTRCRSPSPRPPRTRPPQPAP